MRYIQTFESSKKADEFKYRKNEFIDNLNDYLDELEDYGVLFTIKWENSTLTKLRLYFSVNENWGKYFNFFDIKPTIDNIIKYLKSENFHMEDDRIFYQEPSDGSSKWGYCEYDNLPDNISNLAIWFNLNTR